METKKRATLPFTAIENQDKAKLALILAAINPDINGVLLKGKKGTGKSTLVRALADVLPSYDYVRECPFHCNPHNQAYMCSECRRKAESGTLEQGKKEMEVLTLPLGATEDMIAGTLNVEKALKEGVKTFQPGLLAKANRNVLYIDEINLLPDHLVDVILDAAAMGWNYVEREGVSVSHPARFVLIGSMNPEEGGLRPQLLDRLDLSVEFTTIKEKQKRADIIKKNLEFRKDTETLMMNYQEDQERLKRNISEAKALLERVTISEKFLHEIGVMCKELGIDGHRPDIVIANTSKTLAAFKGRREVTSKDVELAAILALGHRTRERGEVAPPETSKILATLEEVRKKLQTNSERDTRAREGEKSKVQEISPKTSKDISGEFDWAFEPFREQENTKEGDKKEEKRKKPKKQAGTPGSSGPLSLPSFFATRGLQLSGAKKKIKKAGRRASEIFGKFKQKMKSFWKRKPSSKGVVTRPGKKERTVPLRGVSMKDYSVPGQGRVPELPEKEGRIPTPKRLHLPTLRGVRGYSRGRRSPVVSNTSQGRVVDQERPKGPIVDIAFGPTIRAMALRRGKGIRKRDIRVKVREHRAKAILSIVFDTSKSMFWYLSSITKALLKFHEYAWRSKDKVGLIEARGKRAQVILEPTSNRHKIQRAFHKVREGGKTPLASALLEAYEMLTLEKRKNSDVIPVCVVVSDGLGNVELERVEKKEVRDMFPNTYPSQVDILVTARKFSLANIPLLIVNPMHLDSWKHPNVLSPTKLLKEIARITNGKYIGLREGQFSRKRRKDIAERMFRVLRDSLQSLFQSRTK